MKITEAQIRAEAERRAKTFDNPVVQEMYITSFMDIANWALSQDSTIEKVKELIKHYSYVVKVADIAIDSTKGQHETRDHFADRMENLRVQKLNFEGFIEQLNAIIEAK